MTSSAPFGFQLDADVSGLPPDALKSRSSVESFLDDLVKSIGMFEFMAVGMKRQLRFYGDTPDIEGWTAFVPLTTSSIVMHTSPVRQALFLSVFSCDSFDPEDVRGTLRLYFGRDIRVKDRFFER